MNPLLMQLTGQAENRFYGHVHLLAKYCGIEGTPWINGYLQHGWNATDGFGNYLGSKRSANKFVWSKRCENIIKKNGYQNVFAIGAPWLYLADTYPATQNKQKVGVVAYPAHSSAGGKIGDTSEEYAKFLHDKYGEVTVVLHSYDFKNQKNRMIYHSFGHQVTSHGVGTPWEIEFDPFFLKNQRDFLLKFTKAVSNTMSTPLLYANYLGLKTEISGPVDFSIANPDDAASQIGDGLTNWNELLNNNQELWKEELGIDHKKSASELREILGWNPISKKSLSYFINRSKDLVSGSNRFVAIEVFKSKYKKK
jgi:hypothetical protein